MPELYFKGKEYVYNHHLSVPYRPLIAHPDKSIGDSSDNMIIHGDNLHALKALMPRYAGKVDLIFIDPPYNTGNENWSYNDNVNSPMMKEWLDSNPVDKDDMLRHDKWACMIYPRLKLLYELLAENGVLFATIDDVESHRLRGILDEIFGEECYLSTFSWQSKDTPGNNSSGVAETHNYVISYSKQPGLSLSLKERTEKQLDNYSNPDSDERGNWLGAPLTRAEYRERDYYALINPKGTKVFPPKGSSWRRPPKIMSWLQEDNRIWWGVDNDAAFPMEKKFLNEAKEGVVHQTWWPYEFAGSTRNASAELKAIFDGEKPFETPKPTKLLTRIIELIDNPDALVLDSFAGSGTTAHAVLAQNVADRGSRQFILVEGEDYADELTAERVRRVINGYEFQGTQKEELLREKITWSKFNNSHPTLERIQGIENLDGSRFDAIKKTIKDGELIVTGETKITDKVEGLGGDFTFYTLGDPIDIDKILTGEQLPEYDALGGWLFHTATGETLDTSKVKEKKWYLGESAFFHVWLVYKPNLDFLKSREAALTLTLATQMRKSHPDKNSLVFAPAKYVPNKQLLPLGVEYSSLPFALYRIEGE